MKVGTRKSKLALIQSEMFARRCEEACEIIGISTSGDLDRETPLSNADGRGIFVDSLNAMIKSGELDAAVHSAKDLPNNMDPDLEVISAFDWKHFHDVLITRDGRDFSGIGIVGTSSPRREAQIKKMYPGATVKNLRGNVDTRLRKLQSGEYDAIIMSEAAVKRMFPELTYIKLPLENFVPAPNQGIIAVVVRKDSIYRDIIKETSDRKAESRMKMERAVSRAMMVGCSEATGIFFDPESNILRIDTNTEKRTRTVVKTINTESEAEAAGLEVKSYMEK